MFYGIKQRVLWYNYPFLHYGMPVHYRGGLSGVHTHYGIKPGRFRYTHYGITSYFNQTLRVIPPLISPRRPYGIQQHYGINTKRHHG